MSIWASRVTFHDGEDSEGGAPIVYLHSATEPDPEKRGGAVDVASSIGLPILRFTVEEPGAEYPSVSALDHGQAERLRDFLNIWLEEERGSAL